MKKITLFFSIFFVFTFYGQSIKKEAVQFGKKTTNKNVSPTGVIRCYSTEYEKSLQGKFKGRQSTEEFENWIAPIIENIERSKSNGRSPQVVYNIPVVIHIIHNGDCLGTGENITDAQAISQIKVLNEDYRRLAGTRGGANSTGAAVDCEINFVLAKRDPSGNPTNGIDRVQTGLDSYDEAATESVKSTTIWDPTKYLNMWTVRFGGDMDGVLGYAQFPNNSSLAGLSANNGVASTDGVVASFDAFGTEDENDGTFILNPTYNFGRTMTHEVGHWLGLRHIWGDSDINGTSCSLDDYCADTPNALDANFGCPTGANSCTSPFYPGNDMIQNYMDYTDDYCMDTFTANQKSRMVAVMTNSPRRNTLNASNGALAPSSGIYFNPEANYCTVNEGSNCANPFYEVAYNLSIIKAPTQNATVTFNTSGTATNNVDYEILTPSVTFPAGSTNDQTLIIRFFSDSFVEGDETLNVNLVVNANGGDASSIPSKSSLNITIKDDDFTVNSTINETVFNETFDDSPLNMGTIRDLDGDGLNWGISAPGTNSTAIGFDTDFAFSQSWDGTAGLNPDNILYNGTPFSIPSGGNANLSFWVGTTQGGSLYYKEHYSVYLTTINPSTFTSSTLNAQTPVIDDAELAAGASRAQINVDVSSYAGQTVYLVFRHHNTYDMNWIMLDDVLLTVAGTVNVQTEVNAPTVSRSIINGAGTFYAVDSSNGNIMLNATADNFNYGCTSVVVNRSATSVSTFATNYGGNTANNLKVMSKTFTVTPTTNNASGSSSMTFYFTEAEIAGWESETGNSRSALKVFKDGEGSTYATSLGSFGSNVKLTATTPTGLAGVYYFGTDATLKSDTYSPLNAISLYPNPTNNILNVSVPSELGNKVSYEVINYLGQSVVKSNSSNSNFTVNTSNFASGVYFIKLQTENGAKTLKFIKE